MKWVLRILLGLAAMVVLAVAALWLAGLRSDAGHSAAEVVIDRPPAQVFRWLADDDRLKKWIGGLIEIREISTPPNGCEIGKKFRMTEVYKGESVTMEGVTTRFERDRAVSIYVSSVGDPSNGFTETADYTLTDLGGKTRLRLEGQAKYLGFAPRLFEPIITPAATKKLNEDLQRLKSMAEAEPFTINPTQAGGKP
jgi:uncharacterized protein YndB with AHSA1/START domain